MRQPPRRLTSDPLTKPQTLPTCCYSSIKVTAPPPITHIKNVRVFRLLRRRDGQHVVLTEVHLCQLCVSTNLTGPTLILHVRYSESGKLHIWVVAGMQILLPSHGPRQRVGIAGAGTEEPQPLLQGKLAHPFWPCPKAIVWEGWTYYICTKAFLHTHKSALHSKAITQHTRPTNPLYICVCVGACVVLSSSRIVLCVFSRLRFFFLM